MVPGETGRDGVVAGSQESDTGAGGGGRAGGGGGHIKEGYLKKRNYNGYK